MIVLTLERTSSPVAEISFRGPSEIQPLVQSLQSVLKQIDDEHERERDSLTQTLPDTYVKDRALVMLKARHQDRHDNDVRELAALVAQPQ